MDGISRKADRVKKDTFNVRYEALKSNDAKQLLEPPIVAAAAIGQFSNPPFENNNTTSPNIPLATTAGYLSDTAVCMQVALLGGLYDFARRPLPTQAEDDGIAEATYLLLNKTKALHASSQLHLSQRQQQGLPRRKQLRSHKKRADIQTIFGGRRHEFEPSNSVWAACLGSEVVLRRDFDSFISSVDFWSKKLESFKISRTYSEVIFCQVFTDKVFFLFKFGCMVAWDFTIDERNLVVDVLKFFLKEPLPSSKIEADDMNYLWSEKGHIKADLIHLSSLDMFERLAYSYAFAQSVKLSIFETVVDSTIERTKKIPEGLATSGTIKLKREDISRQIGELFVNRFYINLHTDILDTPDIFWDNDDFAEQYENCRSYLEIPKRVGILNQRLDIIKDLYDMLNHELTIQHGYKLEWIVIYLICIEVVIDVVWNILIKGILRWV